MADNVATGDTVQASHYNALIDDILQVFGNPGFGQLIDVSDVISRSLTDINFSASTDVDAPTNTISIVNHNMSNGDLVKYTPNANSAIPGINPESYYYVRVYTVNAVQLTTDEALNDIVDITDDSTGTHTLKKVTAQDVTHTQYNNLLTKINQISQFQRSSDSAALSVNQGDRIGADESDPTPQLGFGGANTTGQNKGLNDLNAAIATIQTDFTNGVVDPENLSGGDIDEPDNVSTRTQQWNGAVYHEFKVRFDGGYNVTNADGTVTQASGADHRRHFFNAGGAIIFEASLSGQTSKDTDWGTMLGNMKRVYFYKNRTETNGTGLIADGATDVDGDGNIEPITGNDNLITSFKTIARKYGSDPVYAENYVQIEARRNSAGDLLTFRVSFVDADVGDLRPGTDEGLSQDGGPWLDGPQLGPDSRTPTVDDDKVDEPVMDDGGLMKSIITSFRATTNITVPAPSFPVSDVDISD